MKHFSTFFISLLISLNANADLEGLLKLPFMLHEENEELLPADSKTTFSVHAAPSENSPIVATITPARIQTPIGKSYAVPRFYYEESALPVIEHKGNWYKVGFLDSAEPGMGFPENYTLAGWILGKDSTPYQPLSDFLQSSMVHLENWDQHLYKTPGGTERFKAPLPTLKIKGTAKLKPEVLKKTGIPCEIPFYANSNKQKLIGICPQNFSFIHGGVCENPDDPTNIMCLKVYIFEELNGLYKIGFKQDLIQFRKSLLNMKIMEQDPDFNFHTGWVEKSYFEGIKPMSSEEIQTAQGTFPGADPSKYDDVDILEHKTVQGQDWVRVKIVTHCSSTDKSFGEGWLPVRKNKKIQFNFVSGGC